MTVVISGTGLYTPEHIITNEELVNSFNQYVEQYNAQHQDQIQKGSLSAKEPSSSSFIEKASGIKQRYVIDKTGPLDPNRMRPYFKEREDDDISLQCEISLKAAHQALDYAQVNPQEIDGVIVACSNFQRPYPAISVEVQQQLSAKGFAFDMNMACSSATFGVSLAKSLIESQQAKTLLVINPEICSAHLDFTDRESHFIFGDACTAIVLQDQNKAQVADFEIIGSLLSTQYSNNIRNNNGFITHTEVANDQSIPLHLFKQQGRKVFKEVVPLVCEHIHTQLTQLNISASKIKRLWLHQANRAMNEFITRRVLDKEFNEQDAPIILDKYANTSSAGSIICFHQHHSDFDQSDLGVICSFGAGYSIGSVLLKKL